MPRSYHESDKKLKTVKIVSKKADVAPVENKKKASKQMATPNKQSTAIVQEDEQAKEEDHSRRKDTEETKDKEEDLLSKDEEKERIPLEEVEQPIMTTVEKLAALGKRPAQYSKAAAMY